MAVSLLACPVAALLAGRAAPPQMNVAESAAKAAWLAKLDVPQWGSAAASPPPVAAAPTSEEEAKRAWLAKLDTPTWSGGRAYPNLPASVKPGVLTGTAVSDLLEDAKKRGCAHDIYAQDAERRPRKLARWKATRRRTRAVTCRTTPLDVRKRVARRRTCSQLRHPGGQLRHFVERERVPRGGGERERAHHDPVLVGRLAVLRRQGPRQHRLQGRHLGR
eukprot:5300678-Prymnesium_polylepis.1